MTILRAYYNTKIFGCY